jgi:hypothetical protein
MIHWIDCDCRNRRKKCEFAPDFVPAGYRWDGGIWAASYMRVESLLLYGKQAAEVIACAAPDGAEENHTIKVKIADEEAEHELDDTEVVWTLEKKT